MPLSANDKAEILDLAARCNHSYDAGSMDEWLDCFAPQGAYAVPSLERQLVGQEALRSFVAKNTPGFPIQTINTAHVIDAHGTGARMLSFFRVLRLDDPPQNIAVGLYEDWLVRLSGAWKLERRDVNLFWSKTASGWL